MRFRTKLLVVFTTTVVAAVALVAWVVSTSIRRAFERVDAERTSALVAQFQREYARQGDEVTRRIEAVANEDSTLRMAVDLNRREPDFSLYLNTAHDLAAAQRLDSLELVANDGTIISSAEWPARFGYKEDWVTRPVDWASQGAFLKKEELPDGVSLTLVAVRAVRAGEKNLYLVGGRRLDQVFLASLALPNGMRALLYRNFALNFSPRDLIDASARVVETERLAPLVALVKQQKSEVTQTVMWSNNPLDEETFHAVPLTGPAWAGQYELLGVLLVGSSRRDEVLLERGIRWVALEVGAAGVMFGVGLSLWAAARVTRPIVRLAGAAREVAGGNWNARVEVTSRDEIGELAESFNRMTGQLLDQRERLLQAERVAA